MNKNKNWIVYILQTKTGKFYTGITTDIKRRLNEHGNKKGAKYFRLEKPQDIVFIETYKNRSDASKREIEIKKFSKDEKLQLIKSRI